MGRKEKKAEEKRILAELDEAVQAEHGEERTPSERGEKIMHCPRCKSVMQQGVCPTCGHKIYLPMSEEKRKKIKGIATIVCLAIFIVLFALIKR